MLTKHEAFLVRELVREQIVTLKDCIKLLHGKDPMELDIRTIKHYQAELKHYETIYNKLLEEVREITTNKKPASSANDTSNLDK